MSIGLGLLLVGAVTWASVLLKNKWKPLGREQVVVRCAHGHLFTTTWVVTTTPTDVPAVQRCPVCHRWTQVTLVNESRLTDAERKAARRNSG